MNKPNVTTKLTGKVRMIIHERESAPDLLVAQVEEKITRIIKCPVLNYSSVSYEYRNATPEDWEKVVNTHRPVVSELKRIGAIDAY